MHPNQLEAAARHWCQLAGQDPDALVPHKPLIGPNGPINETPRWSLVAPQLMAQYRVNEAIRIGLATSPIITT